MRNNKILITGANGLVGSALIYELKNAGFNNVTSLSRNECNLMNTEEVINFFDHCSPEYVFHNAASVYGIGGNHLKKGDVFYENICINSNVIQACKVSRVKKIIAMGTVAAYPDAAPTPLIENSIWNGPPHKSEDSYAHAKRAMLAHLESYKEQYNLDFAFVISTNLYGINDKFNKFTGHVIPSLIKKFHEAKINNSIVEVWGNGSASRDFLYANDLAKALILILEKFSGTINVGSSIITPIKDVVSIISEHYKMNEQFIWNKHKPNGRSFCELDLSKIHSLGFKPQHTLKQGLIKTLKWFDNALKFNLIRD